MELARRFSPGSIIAHQDPGLAGGVLPYGLIGIRLCDALAGKAGCGGSAQDLVVREPSLLVDFSRPFVPAVCAHEKRQQYGAGLKVGVVAVSPHVGEVAEVIAGVILP